MNSCRSYLARIHCSRRSLGREGTGWGTVRPERRPAGAAARRGGPGLGPTASQVAGLKGHQLWVLTLFANRIVSPLHRVPVLKTEMSFTYHKIHPFKGSIQQFLVRSQAVQPPPGSSSTTVHHTKWKPHPLAVPPHPGPNRESASCRDISCAWNVRCAECLGLNHVAAQSPHPPPLSGRPGSRSGPEKEKARPAPACGARPVLPGERLPSAAVVAGRRRAAGRGDKAVSRGRPDARSPRPLPSPRPPPPVGSPTSSQLGCHGSHCVPIPPNMYARVPTCTTSGLPLSGDTTAETSEPGRGHVVRKP